jgi:hypothetical protein
MKQYSKVKRQYHLTFRGCDDVNTPDFLFTIDNQGANYTSAPTLTIASNANGYGATATCTVAAGKITSVKLTNKGFGYSNCTLTVTLAGGGGTSGAITAVLVYNSYSKSIKNNGSRLNSKRYRFELIGAFNNVQLSENAKVAIENVVTPINSLTTGTVSSTYVRLRDINDNVFDTEQGMNNKPLILVSNQYLANTYNYITTSMKESNTFRVPRNFLSKGYIEFDLYIEVLKALAANVIFDENNFSVSMVVYEDDFEESTDLITAPQVVEGQQYKLHNNFYPNYNNK